MHECHIGHVHMDSGRSRHWDLHLYEGSPLWDLNQF